MDTVDWWCCSVLLCPYYFLLSACWICFWWSGIKVFSCNCWFFYLSLYFYQFLPYVFWCSIVEHIDIKDCYIFLENWPLLTLCSISLYPSELIIFLFLEFVESKISITTLSFFSSVLEWHICIPWLFILYSVYSGSFFFGFIFEY